MAKETRKELLNSQDEFITTTGSIIKWIRKYPGRAIAIGLITVIVIGSSIGFFYWRQARKDHAITAYFHAGEEISMVHDASARYADTRAGKLGILKEARLHFEQKDYDKAIGLGNQFINTCGHKDIFYYQALILTAAAYMETKDHAEALTRLENCAGSGSEDLRNQALFYKAVILNQTDKKAEAQEILKNISGDYGKLGKAMQTEAQIQPEETVYAE